MKRVFVLFAIALMSTIVVNAKTVRGHVSDEEGRPVAGLQLRACNVDRPDRPTLTVTDADGYFEIQVPDFFDMTDIKKVFSRGKVRVINFDNAKSWLSITIDRKLFRYPADSQLIAGMPAE